MKATRRRRAPGGPFRRSSRARRSSALWSRLAPFARDRPSLTARAERSGWCAATMMRCTIPPSMQRARLPSRSAPLIQPVAPPKAMRGALLRPHRRSSTLDALRLAEARAFLRRRGRATFDVRPHRCEGAPTPRRRRARDGPRRPTTPAVVSGPRPGDVGLSARAASLARRDVAREAAARRAGGSTTSCSATSPPSAPRPRRHQTWSGLTRRARFERSGRGSRCSRRKRPRALRPPRRPRPARTRPRLPRFLPEFDNAVDGGSPYRPAA